MTADYDGLYQFTYYLFAVGDFSSVVRHDVRGGREGCCGVGERGAGARALLGWRKGGGR